MHNFNNVYRKLDKFSLYFYFNIHIGARPHCNIIYYVTLTFIFLPKHVIVST